jgi:hypothetical protein
MTVADLLALLKEYGLAGVLAWLFWWTLRRMIASHDATVSQLKGQLETECEAARAAGEGFAKVVENHLSHVIGAIERFEATLCHHTEDQRRWQDRLLQILDHIAARLTGERSAT